MWKKILLLIQMVIVQVISDELHRIVVERLGGVLCIVAVKDWK